MMSKRRLDTWWENHPLFNKFYVPFVLTATFFVSIIDVVTGGKGK